MPASLFSLADVPASETVDPGRFRLASVPGGQIAGSLGKDCGYMSGRERKGLLGAVVEVHVWNAYYFSAQTLVVGWCRLSRNGALLAISETASGWVRSWELAKRTVGLQRARRCWLA
jgi:fructose 1,6-bisphosphatase